MLKKINLIIKIFLIINILLQFPLEKENIVSLKKQKTILGSSKISIFFSNILTIFFIFIYLLINIKLNNLQ
uniref:Preprotein translocase SecG subunit n=1 Tax=Nitzschia sp. PL3-2 TaxID=2083271 RepID=A0A2Z5ZAQ1_9STRA|nr:Preprotein translocase SecG subunit [Nitzschia sp. PL3-2]